jgi:hypothetical protein
VTPDDYIESLEEPRRGDVRALHELIRATAPDLEPHVASGMLGYAPFHYRYASGREGDASLIALASRKQYISLYVLCTTERDTSPSSTPSGCRRRTSARAACASSTPPTSAAAHWSS